MCIYVSTPGYAALCRCSNFYVCREIKWLFTGWLTVLTSFAGAQNCIGRHLTCANRAQLLYIYVQNVSVSFPRSAWRHVRHHTYYYIKRIRFHGFGRLVSSILFCGLVQYEIEPTENGVNWNSYYYVHILSLNDLRIALTSPLRCGESILLHCISDDVDWIGSKYITFLSFPSRYTYIL